MSAVSTFFQQFTSSTCARAIQCGKDSSMLAAAGKYENSILSWIVAAPGIALSAGFGLLVTWVISYIKSFFKQEGWAVVGPLIAVHSLEKIEGEGEEEKNKIAFNDPIWGEVEIRDLTIEQLATLDFWDVKNGSLDGNTKECLPPLNKTAISITINGVERIVKGMTVVEVQEQIRADLFANKSEYADFLQRNTLDDKNFKKAIVLHKLEAGKNLSEQEKTNKDLNFSPDELAIVRDVYSAKIGEPEESKPMHDASLVFQKLIRSHKVWGLKEPGADVPALRNEEGKAIAYKVLPDDQEHFPYVPFPVNAVHSTPNGSYKALTHRTAQPRSNGLNYVGLTLDNPGSPTLDPKFLTIIAENNLDKIKPQIRVNQSQLIAEDLGRDNLSQQMFKRQYAFDPIHFKDLASNIDTLHRLGIVHRDIKPENMFFKDGEIYLTDNDTMGMVGSFQSNIGTRAYLAPEFLFGGMSTIHDNADRDQSNNAYKKDQYAFFMSMITVCLSTRPTFGRFNEVQIDAFLQTVPCTTPMKNELKSFLLSPTQQSLSFSLFDYLTDAETSDVEFS